MKMDSTSRNSRLIKNTSLLYIRMIFVMFISLYTTRVILNTLGVEDFGVYNVVCGFVALFSFLNKCLTTGSNRFFNFALGKKDYDGVRQIFCASIVIQFCFLVLLVLIIEVTGVWYIQNQMVLPYGRMTSALIIFQFSVISLALVIMQAPYSAAVLAYEKMNVFATVSIIEASLKLIFVILLPIVNGDKLIVYAALMMLISVITCLTYIVYCHRKFSTIRFSFNFDRKIFKSLLTFSGWSILDPLAFLIRDQGSNLVLNSFFGAMLNAAYGISGQVSSAVYSFASNLSVAFRPQIIQSYSSGEYQRTAHLMVSMSKINFILQALIGIPISFEMSSLLHLWLGEVIPEYSIAFATAVVYINMINTLNEPVSIVIVATGRIAKARILSAIILMSTVPLCYICFKWNFPPIYIYATILLTTIVNQIVSVKIMCILFKTLTSWHYVRLVVCPCVTFIICSAVMPTLIITVLQPSIFRVVVLTVVTDISALFVAYYICLNEIERDLLKEPIKRIFNKKRI